MKRTVLAEAGTIAKAQDRGEFGRFTNMTLNGGISISMASLGTTVFGHENKIFEGTGWRLFDIFRLRSKVRIWESGQ